VHRIKSSNKVDGCWIEMETKEICVIYGGVRRRVWPLITEAIAKSPNKIEFYRFNGCIFR
jgi:hypothetical protein